MGGAAALQKLLREDDVDLTVAGSGQELPEVAGRIRTAR